MDRGEARRIWEAGLAAADPAAGVAAALEDVPGDRPTLVIAAGKAALRMLDGAAGWLAKLPEPAEVLAVTNAENAGGRAGVMVGEHPVPGEGSLAAGRAVIAALGRTGEGARVLALLSGGASALLAAPAPGLTLADEAEVARLLLASGADIREANLVRQHLSVLKGGGLARLAAPAEVVALILSDVIGDDLRAVASGPTSGPLGTPAEALALCARLGIADALPRAVLAHLAAAEARPVPEAANVLVGSNALSLAAMGRAALGARVHAEPLVGDVAEAAARVMAAGPGVHLFGGETTVKIRGQGRGGRNQELALRVALLAEEAGARLTFLAAGTDGRDGPTEAAGGIVDEGTAARIREAGGDPEALLADNDSHAALALSGDLMLTGGTGTNVADLAVLIRRA